MGVPTVAVSFRLNLPDERIVASLPGVAIVSPESPQMPVIGEMLTSYRRL